MPFASILAFIDSIQEDSRDISKLDAKIRFLEKLIIERPRSVRAKVNLKALNDEDILWKLIESRDVHSTLLESAKSITLNYPSWMIN